MAAVAGIVHQECLWQLCRDELTGVDFRVDGRIIRGRTRQPCPGMEHIRDGHSGVRKDADGASMVRLELGSGQRARDTALATPSPTGCFSPPDNRPILDPGSIERPAEAAPAIANRRGHEDAM